MSEETPNEPQTQEPGQITEPPQASEPPQQTAPEGQVEAEATQQAAPDPSVDHTAWKKLMYRERQIREREKSQKEYDARISAYEEAQKLARENPLEAMKKLGINYEDATKQILNDGEATPDQRERALQDRIVELERRAEEKDKVEQERELQGKITNYHNTINGVVDSDKERWPTLNVEGVAGLLGAQSIGSSVWEIISQHYNDTGETMQYENAADLLENYVVNQYSGVIKNLASIDKFGLHSNNETDPGPGLVSESQTQEPQAVANFRPTLSNKQSAEVPARGADTWSPDRDDEFTRAAAEALRHN